MAKEFYTERDIEDMVQRGERRVAGIEHGLYRVVEARRRRRELQAYEDRRQDDEDGNASFQDPVGHGVRTHTNPDHRRVVTGVGSRSGGRS